MVRRFKHFNNGEQPIIVDLVSYFSRYYFLKKKDYQVQLAQDVQSQLTDNYIHGIAE